MLSILRSTSTVTLYDHVNNQESIEDKVAKKNKTFLCIPLPRTWFSSKLQLAQRGEILCNEMTKKVFLEIIKTNYGINELNPDLKAHLNKNDDRGYWTKIDVRKLFRLVKQVNNQTREHKQKQIYRLDKEEKSGLQIYEKGTFANKKISRNQSNPKSKIREALVKKNLMIIISNLKLKKTENLTIDRRGFDFTKLKKRFYFDENKDMDTMKRWFPMIDQPCLLTIFIIILNKIINEQEHKRKPIGKWIKDRNVTCISTKTEVVSYSRNDLDFIMAVCKKW